jgi:PhzF family phenazine biosynthesis protein
MKIPLFQVDSFTVKPFKGNPAGVCLLDHPRDEAWMQAVANEMRLSETAFLSPKGNDFYLRWFTPSTEVDLCGHATLASAHVLFELGYYDPDETIYFHTKSGVLTATFKHGTIELDMPLIRPIPAESSPLLEEILGQAPLEVAHSEDKKILLAEIANPSDIEAFVPDFKKIALLEENDLIITAACTDGKTDFISRFFSPHTGIPEDPVTGLGHCILTPYWANKLNKNQLTAYQASERGGTVWCRLGKDRVFLGGKAVTLFSGEILHQK